VGRIRGFLGAGELHQVVTVNLDFVAIARRDAYFQDTLNAAELAVADGMPLVWLSRLGKYPLPQHVTGIEMAEECWRIAAVTGAGVAAAAAETLRAKFPGLRVTGAYTPPFGPLTLGENDTILGRIEEARPGFLFVALGAPQEDVW
jgi:N-acetylglucosaminyldiphosphoundecaprenol N-acetyl-beta-D-mannosaminyltransferase